ncbi:bidirectional sugar transporter SWEET6b [Tripterygium wilfordii]|uniref:Bidirectional sugar transporter SWEET n=1 Tax=Tripterygium wilfordii TaxID=458696 RepID=A0A7J7D1X5_TRIWF|nr:bidirectional sugar transporter SWEET4-like [Tripterygium wilfordii]KAF5740362.1 bidirectional sugar transporter SWEET6b [Tripterygium wilfordii]
MVSASTARNIVGIIGNVISFGLFLSPVPTFYNIFKNKNVEEFQPYPYIATVMNCLSWVFYGMPFVTPDSVLVVTINGIGLVIELIYLSIFVIYDKENKGRKKVGLGLLLEVIFLVIMVVITMVAFHGHGRNIFVGVICDVFNIMMYTSPLLIAIKVVKTKSVKYMPFYLSLANFANGSIWTAYALIKLDPFLLTSNGVGSISGLLQLILYACYYRSTPKDEEVDVVKPSQVQLSGAARV